MLSKVEQDTLSFLQADSWEISLVRSDFNTTEGNAQEVLITPEYDLTSIQIDQCTDHVAHGPPLSEMWVILIPFLDSEAIVSIWILRIANAIIWTKGCITTAPANLHEPISQ